MRYQFVYKRNGDWSFDELKLIQETVQFTDSLPRHTAIREVGSFLSEITNVKLLIIGRFVAPQNQEIETLCFLNHGQPIPNIIYKLQGTPCQGITSHRICYYPVSVQQEFPQDPDLAEMNIESYMGTALNDPEGNPIGLVALLHDRTIENPGLVEHLLQLLSPVLEESLPEHP